MVEEVFFRVDGVEVAADLYLPSDLEPGDRRPAIVAGHGFSFVKEGLVLQGEMLSNAGYVVLAIDYRSFGRSGGGVRGELFPERQIDDFRGGISYLETRSEVEADRIGLWGTSFAGALVLATAARDRRVRATVAQVPIVDGREWMQFLRTPEQWERLLDELDADRRRRFRGEASTRIPIALPFSATEVCGMPADQQTAGLMSLLRGISNTWRQDIALESIDKILHFSPRAVIGQISPRPLCIIACAGYEVIHPLQPILEAYAAAHEPKRLVLLPYDQLGLYAEPGAGHAIRVALEFLHETLPVGSSVGGAIRRTGFSDVPT
jgi:acetyl esterase/lipase